MSERERIAELRLHAATTLSGEALDGWEKAIRERDEARELVRRLCDEGGHCSCDSLPDGYKCKSCKVFSAADVKVSEWGLS